MKTKLKKGNTTLRRSMTQKLEKQRLKLELEKNKKEKKQKEWNNSKN